MNKGDLIDLVAGEMKTSKAEAARSVETVLDCITKGVITQDRVALAGFGTFQKKSRPARMGTNPATKQPMQIAASTTCGFKPASALKEAL